MNRFEFISKTYYLVPEAKGIKLPEKAQTLGKTLVDAKDIATTIDSIRGELKTYSGILGLSDIPLDDAEERQFKKYSLKRL